MFGNIDRSRNIVSNVDSLNVQYIDNFLTKREANLYFKLLEKNLEYYDQKISRVMIRGKKIDIPRKQVAYGDDGTYYKFCGTNIPARTWSDDLVSKVILKIKQKIEQKLNETFNFCLINRYQNGKQYIGFHSDDYRQLGEKHNIVGISLGVGRDFLLKAKNFVPENVDEKISIYLDHGSLICMLHPTNIHWKHAVPKRTKIRKPRISLTFRKMLV